MRFIVFLMCYFPFLVIAGGIGAYNTDISGSVNQHADVNSVTAVSIGIKTDAYISVNNVSTGTQVGGSVNQSTNTGSLNAIAIGIGTCSSVVINGGNDEECLLDLFSFF